MKTSELRETKNTTFKIATSHISIKYSEPWTVRKSFSGNGTGFAIEIDRHPYIMTNAHVVNMAIKINVVRYGKSHPAKIVGISYECDLALLSVESNEFWKSTDFLELGKMPAPGEKVYVHGFPLGGDNVSITKGVVSRIDIVDYSNFVNRIAVQIDAAINPGNSGGPVINKGGQVVGVAFSGIDNADNMGYAIPVVIVQHFIDYIVKFGKFMGLCDLDIRTQRLENAELRHWVGLPAEKSGILITRDSSDGKGLKILKAGDVLMAIDGKKIDYSGNMKLSDIAQLEQESNEIAGFENYVGIVLPGKTMELEVFRDGKTQIVKTKAEIFKHAIPQFPTDVNTQYVIIGGLVFVVLSQMLIKEKEERGFPFDSEIKHDRQTIVLSKILQSEYTHGYHYDLYVLHSVNDIEIMDMKQLINIAAKARKSSKRLVFKYSNSSNIHVISAEANNEKTNRSVIEANLGMVEPLRVGPNS